MAIKTTIPTDIQVYTVKEVAALLHTNTNFVYRLIKSKKLKSIKLGSSKITHASLSSFLETYDGEDLSEYNKAS